MSEIKVNKITPRVACGTTQLGDSGDTFTIPSGATITNAGTASGFGATGETSWDTTVKTTGTFTATAGVGYFLNTTGGTITVNLPVGAAGSSVALADYAGTWQTNNVTVAANGTEKIGGIDADVTLNTEGQAVTFVYIDGTQGWVNVLDSTSNVRGIPPFIGATGGTPACGTTCGDYKYHKFTGPGTFCVSRLATCCAAVNNLVSYMVVAGGGGGGSGRGGGGGAGGFREVVSPGSPYTGSPLNGYPSAPLRITVTKTAYPITVGAGGAGQPGPSNLGVASRGANSVFSTITSNGGGGGRDDDSPAPPNPDTNGGSGGGAGGGASPVNIGGNGNSPATPVAQGTNGGPGAAPAGPLGNNGAGGGGATVAGTSTVAGSAGGAGATTSITGSPTAYAGGGGGGSCNGCLGSGPGGIGGGGAGGTIPGATGSVGVINTGGGAGGKGGSCSTGCGGLGGSGIVIIRYKYK